MPSTGPTGSSHEFRTHGVVARACARLQHHSRHRQSSGAVLRTQQSTSEPPESLPAPLPPNISRRHHLAALGGPLFLPALSTHASQVQEVDLKSTAPDPPNLPPTSTPTLSPPNYSHPGPFRALKLPQLEHTCTTCDAPADRCRLKIHAWAPKGGAAKGLSPPYPLALISPGFLVAADQYSLYAERLSSWGWVVVTYDNTQQALDPINDVVSVAFLRDLIDWCTTSAPLGSLCDSSSVYLIGHSRGGKISALAAVKDPRVQAVFLLDPVDVTVYAPLSPGYPSAVAQLAGLARSGRSLPIAVIGSGRAGDCVPDESNYKKFYEVIEAPAWEATIADAGHLQFLSARSATPMDLVCVAGKVPDVVVAELTGAMIVAWGEEMVRRGWRVGGGGDGGIDPHTDPRHLRMGLDANGNLVAGVGTFDSMQMLFATEMNVRNEIRVRLGIDIDLSMRAKNFELLSR